MILSPKGLQFIADREHLELKAMRPLPNDVWTIGYGHTAGVYQGMIIDAHAAMEFLKDDVQDAVNGVKAYVRTLLEQHQFDAVVSLVFNIGKGAFGRSMALKCLNADDLDAFCHQAFDPAVGFVKSGGVVIKGLVNRREMERKLFLEGEYT